MRLISPRALLTFCSLLLVITLNDAARAEKLPLKNYTTADGLAHDTVHRIVRDSRGFLWFCTGEGLSRFDGYQFKSYTRDDGLPHRSVNDLIETRDGRYWVATSGGLVLFNPHGTPRRWTGENTGAGANDEALMFRVISAPDAPQGKRNVVVSDIIEDRAGNIWCATNTGLHVLRRASRENELRRVDKDAWQGKAQEIGALIEDDAGALWVLVGVHIYRLLPDGVVQTIPSGDFGFVTFFKDKNGHIWIGNGGHEKSGLHQFAYEGLAQPRLVRVYTERDGLSSRAWHYGILETSDGTLWVGSVNGLSASTNRAADGVTKFRAVSNFVVSSLGEDAGGNVWIGSESSGAFRLSRSGIKSFDQADGLKTVRGLSIVPGAGGEVYVVSNTNKIIQQFDGEKFTAVAPREMVKGSWGFNQYHFQDKAGEWWVAGGDGLQRYPRVGRLEELANTKPKAIYTTKDGLPSAMIFRLFEDSRGDLWIGTLGGTVDSLARWDRRTEKFHTYTTRDNLPASDGPTAFAEDRAGSIWIGYYNGGVVRWRKNRFQIFREKDGVPSGLVRDIYADSAGRLWIATSSNGVVRADNPDADEPQMVNLSTAEGLASNQATCVIEDTHGRIYIGTGRGVNSLNPRDGSIKLFTSADGLAENFVSVCERDRSGALWFGFYRGLSRFVPAPDARGGVPHVFISDVRVNGEKAARFSELGETRIENLDFDSDGRQVQIDFFALGFSTGEQLFYQYKLDGVDADWSRRTTQRTVNLNLAAGAYRFLVRAVSSEGVASENPALVSFTIARPLWQRWWVLLLTALVLSAAVYVLYRFRIAQIIKLERVRTRIATDLHDDIGASLSKIAILSEVVSQRVAPVARDDSGITEPLTQIAGTSREMVDSMSDIVWAINPHRDHLSDLTQRMRNLAGEMTELCDIRLRVQLSGVEGKDVSLGADMRREIYLIFKETINNMVKHSDCSLAEVEFRLEGDNLVVIVKDNGKGFTVSKGIDSATNNSNGNSNGNGNGDGNNRTRGGNGLGNMRRRAKALGGDYNLESQPGAGTTATLRVPVGGAFGSFSRSSLTKLLPKRAKK